MRTCCLILALLSGLSLFANDRYELGNVTKEELQETSCSFAPEAHAYFIFDKGECQLNSNGRYLEVEMTRKLKLKVLDQQGVDAATFLIDLWYGSELNGVKGYTYNLVNGEIEKIKLHRDNVLEDEIHDELTEATINMPQVKVGSIIELQYRLNSPSVVYLQDWVFQGEYPRELSSYETYEPKDLVYDRSFRGFIPINQLKPQKVSRGIGPKMYTCYRHVYYAEEVPAFKTERFLSSPRNFISRIEFKLVKSTFPGESIENYGASWLDVDKDFIDYRGFGQFLGRTADARVILTSLGPESATHEDLMVEIYQLMRARLHWNGRHRYSAKELPLKIWEEKTGSSGDLNLLLTLLLREAGLEAEPVLLSTRSHGEIIGHLPASYHFNHTVARVMIDSVPHFLDLTDKYVSAGFLPYKDLNQVGRMPLSHQWVNLLPAGAQSSQEVYTLQVDPSATKLKGTVQVKLKDYAAVSFLSDADGKANDQLVKELRSEHENIEIEKLEHGDLVSGQDVTYELKFGSTSHIEKLGERLMIQPFVIEEISNPFLEEERLYPVDYGYPINQQVMVTLQIPEGYKVSSLPEASKVVLPNGAGEFLYQAVPLGSALQINYIFKINQVLFASDDYALLREFYGLQIDKLQEMIVLEKS